MIKTLKIVAKIIIFQEIIVDTLIVITLCFIGLPIALLVHPLIAITSALKEFFETLQNIQANKTQQLETLYKELREENE